MYHALAPTPHSTLLTHCTLVCRFYPSEVKKHAEDVINEILSQNTEYDEDTCYQYTLDITNGIKDRVKGACRVSCRVSCAVRTVGRGASRTMPPGPGCLWQGGWGGGAKECGSLELGYGGQPR